MKHITVLMSVAVVFLAGPMLLAAEPGSESATSSEAPMQQMHSHMQMMPEQIEQMHASDDPEERGKMMREHSQAIVDGGVMMAEMEAADMHKMMNMNDMEMQGKDSQGMADGLPCQRMVAMHDQHHDMQEHGQMTQEMMEHMTEHQSMQVEPSE